MILGFLPQFTEFVSQPWPWYVAGPLIALSMFLLLYFGGEFGVSGNLRTVCTIGGAGRFADFFRFDWQSQVWNLIFVAGSIMGGFIAAYFMQPPDGNEAHISAATIETLHGIGVQVQAGEVPMVPDFLSWENLLTPQGLFIMLGGGFLVGFGARYAGGCTSGHAISGLSNLQLPSLIAVIGFFIGGLLMSHLILPMLF